MSTKILFSILVMLCLLMGNIVLFHKHIYLLSYRSPRSAPPVESSKLMRTADDVARGLLDMYPRLSVQQQQYIQRLSTIALPIRQEISEKQAEYRKQQSRLQQWLLEQ